jgi:HEAT repeat protein
MPSARWLVVCGVLICSTGIALRANGTKRTTKTQPTAIEQLIDRIYRESAGNTRTSDAESLADLVKQAGPNGVSPKVVSDLTGLLSDSSDSVRYFAATALGYLGQRASTAIPALEQALREREGKRASKSSASAIRLALERIRSAPTQLPDSKDGSAS